MNLDSLPVVTVVCPSCKHISRQPQIDVDKDKPDEDKMRTVICSNCLEVLMSRTITAPFKVMTAREFCYYMDYDSAMRIAQTIQKMLGNNKELI